MATTNTGMAMLVVASAAEAGAIMSERNGQASRIGGQRSPTSLERVLNRAQLAGSFDSAGSRSFPIRQPATFANRNIMPRSFENIPFASSHHQLGTIGFKHQDLGVALATSEYYSLVSRLQFEKKRSDLLLQALTRSPSPSAQSPSAVSILKETVPAVVSTSPRKSSLKFLRSNTMDGSELSSDQEDDSSISTTVSTTTEPRVVKVPVSLKRKACIPLRSPPQLVTIAVEPDRKASKRARVVGPLTAPQGRLCNPFPSVPKGNTAPRSLPKGIIQDTPQGVVSGPAKMSKLAQHSRWVTPLRKGISTTLMN